MNHAMLLLADVGNTNTVFGLADLASSTIVQTWRIASDRNRTPDEWYALVTPLFTLARIDFNAVSGGCLASVVPAISRALISMFHDRVRVRPLVVSADLDLGITIGTDAPAEVGADRLVNAAYGFHEYGGPLIVVDLGTATKIEAISAEGVFPGGVIAPGLGLSLEALASRAARLYAVELAPPPSAVGRNTVHAVQSGVVIGHAAMIEGMIAHVRSELGGANRVILTGGHASILESLCPSVTDWRPDLTLAGLAYLWQRNRSEIR